MVDEYTAGGRLEAQKEFRYNCPFCGEERHKFYVQSDSPYLWHCKQCDRSGNPVKFTMLLNSVSFDDAKDILETYDYYVGNIEQTKLQENFSNQELTDSEKLFLLIQDGSGSLSDKVINYKPNPLPVGFKLLWDNKRNKESFPYFNYLINRKISLEMIRDYKIGYVDRGSYTHPETGKVLPLRTSIVFVTYDIKGNPIYWNTRSIDSNSPQKSLNAPADSETYSKRNTVFNLNRAIKTDKIVIYEGVLNALMSGDSGVATFGKQITDEQIDLIKNSIKGKDIPIYLFLDNDAKSESRIISNKIYKFTKNLYIVINPYGDKDANDLGQETVNNLINNAIKYDNSGRAQILFSLS